MVVYTHTHTLRQWWWARMNEWSFGQCAKQKNPFVMWPCFGALKLEDVLVFFKNIYRLVF